MKSRAKIKLEKLKQNDGGGLLSKEHLGLFNEDLKGLAEKHFSENNVSDGNIQRFIFDECMLQAKKARSNGKKSV